MANRPALGAGTDGPAGMGDAAARKARPVSIDVAEREPAGEVRQEAIESIAHAPARSGKPVVARLATGRAQHRRRPFDAGPVDVAFCADDRTGELPVVADRTADEAAREVERIYGVPLRATPAAAAVAADIEAAPGLDRSACRVRLGIPCEIGGGGRPSRQRQ